MQECVKSGAPSWEEKGGEAENSRHRLNLTLIWKEDTNFRKAKSQGASFSRLPASFTLQKARRRDPLHPQHTDKPGSCSSHPNPGSWRQAARGAASQPQVCGGSQGEAAHNCKGCRSLTPVTMEPVQGAGTSCPRPPQAFGCHQPEVNRFCSSNKLVTKATVLIPKCN